MIYEKNDAEKIMSSETAPEYSAKNTENASADGIPEAPKLIDNIAVRLKEDLISNNNAQKQDKCGSFTSSMSMTKLVRHYLTNSRIFPLSAPGGSFT